MTYAVDTNVILDILLADPEFGPSSRDFISQLCNANDSLVACDVVWSEASAAFNDKAAFTRQMNDFGIAYSPMPDQAAIRAGAIWRLARAASRTAKVRQRLAIIPDFLIGAHALECADALITRDRGFMHKWFADLKIVDPSKS